MAENGAAKFSSLARGIIGCAKFLPHDTVDVCTRNRLPCSAGPSNCLDSIPENSPVITEYVAAKRLGAPPGLCPPAAPATVRVAVEEPWYGVDPSGILARRLADAERAEWLSALTKQARVDGTMAPYRPLSNGGPCEGAHADSDMVTGSMAHGFTSRAPGSTAEGSSPCMMSPGRGDLPVEPVVPRPETLRRPPQGTSWPYTAPGHQMVLVPKHPNATHREDFRPISVSLLNGVPEAESFLLRQSRDPDKVYP